jgi:hypothetical protein
LNNLTSRFVGLALSILCLQANVAAAGTCPPPSRYNGSCVQLIVWAINPDDGSCCVYATPCSAPTDGWILSYSGCYPSCEENHLKPCKREQIGKQFTCTLNNGTQHKCYGEEMDIPRWNCLPEEP